MAELVVAADLGEYPRLIAWAEAFVASHALPNATSFAIQLCLEEAFTNVVQHGYAGAPGDVRVSLTLDDGAVLLGLADRGVPFDPTAVPPPAPATSIMDAPVGGRGIQLMRKFADRLQYERADGENRFRLHIPRPAVSPAK